MDKKKKILVVDDEPDFVEVIKTRLEASGYEVITAPSGKEALDKVASGNPDAVILDILMPGMDGLKVLKKIRSQNKNLPIFIISAFSTEERFKLARELDASGFIIKTGDLGREIENITGALRIADKYKGKERGR
ncbi:MAG: response regulator [Candidatus Omnitrophota bacterium]|nr:MAG: response regulator [Candidatus Omnitrophota bacterium]